MRGSLVAVYLEVQFIICMTFFPLIFSAGILCDSYNVYRRWSVKFEIASKMLCLKSNFFTLMSVF